MTTGRKTLLNPSDETQVRPVNGHGVEIQQSGARSSIVVKDIPKYLF